MFNSKKIYFKAILVFLSLGIILAQPTQQDFQELIQDDNRLNVLLCTSAISYMTNQKEEMLRIQNLVKESTIDEIRKDPNIVKNFFLCKIGF